MYHANFVLIAIPMSGKHSLKVLSRSDIAIMGRLQIETLKFVHSSCCFTIPELVLSDQLNPDTKCYLSGQLIPAKKVLEQLITKPF